MSSGRPPKESAITYLYRSFDRDGRLLYVGISVSPATRLGSHVLTAPWWPLARTITIEPFLSRESAGDAETKAIREEHPIHNVALHKENHRASRLNWISDKYSNRASFRQAAEESVALEAAGNLYPMAPIP